MNVQKELNTAEILGVHVAGSSEFQVLNRIGEWIGGSKNTVRQKRLIFTPNPEMLVDANGDKSFLKMLNSSDLNIPDGVGLVVANRYLRMIGRETPDQTISSRLAGVDLVVKMMMAAASRGWRVYLLGGGPGVAQEAESKIKAWSGEVASGFEVTADSGPRDVASMTGVENEKLIARVNKFNPDILLVAFGHKKQEKWLVENRDKLKFGVGMGVGGSLDFISGQVRRAPVWMRRVGLEWFFRLIQEPRRFGRQLKLLKFVWLVVRGA